MCVRRATYDDRFIRIPCEEADKHLSAHARQGVDPESGACPALTYADPARAPFVALSFAIPGQSDAHSPIFVGERSRDLRDLLSARLQSMHHGFLCPSGGTVRQIREDGLPASHPLFIVLAVELELR